MKCALESKRKECSPFKSGVVRQTCGETRRKRNARVMTRAKKGESVSLPSVFPLFSLIVHRVMVVDSLMTDLASFLVQPKPQFRSTYPGPFSLFSLASYQPSYGIDQLEGIFNYTSYGDNINLWYVALNPNLYL